MNSTNLICLVLAGFGALFVYQSKRRSFTRTNWLGIEQFSSYRSKVLSKLMDSTLLAIGYGCVGGALVILLVEYASEYLVMGAILWIALWLDDEWHARRKQ
ncbi:MAG: hypothetical protein WBO95_15970 [Candidatus Dechloromonas phosphoritropha]